MQSNVFLSWSGERSLAVAEALRDWLPKVIQVVKPWLSADDVDRGARWAQEIGKQLQESSVGILCMTAENLDAQWIMFEAGALSKALDDSRVIPYLLDVESTDLKGPLAHFNAAKATKADTLKMLTTINRTLENGLKDEDLRESFEVRWPHLEPLLKEIQEQPVAKPGEQIRTDRDLLEELLELTRAQERRAVAQRAVAQEDYNTFLKLVGKAIGERDLMTWIAKHPFAPPSDLESLGAFLRGRTVRTNPPNLLTSLLEEPTTRQELEPKPPGPPRKLKRRRPPLEPEPD